MRSAVSTAGGGGDEVDCGAGVAHMSEFGVVPSLGAGAGTVHPFICLCWGLDRGGAHNAPGRTPLVPYRLGVVISFSWDLV